MSIRSGTEQKDGRSWPVLCFLPNGVCLLLACVLGCRRVVFCSIDLLLCCGGRWRVGVSLHGIGLWSSACLGMWDLHLFVVRPPRFGVSWTWPLYAKHHVVPNANVHRCSLGSALHKLSSQTQTPGRIHKEEPPIMDSNTPKV